MPEWSAEIRRRLASANLRPEREAEIVDEVAQHLDDRYRELLAIGQTPTDAADAAWRELDAGDRLAHEVASADPPAPYLPPIGAAASHRWWRSLAQDARYAARRLTNRPALSLTVLSIVALTIGPATAVLGTADAVFLRMPGGLRQPKDLVILHFANPAGDTAYSPVAPSYAIVKDMVAAAPSVAAAAGQASIDAGLAASGADPLRMRGQAVQSNYFNVVGAAVIAGRPLAASDDEPPGGATSVVLSLGAATQFFGGAQAAIGKTLTINSVPFTVVGVADAAFAGTDQRGPSMFWIPGAGSARVRHLDPRFWDRGPNRGPSYEFIIRAADGATVGAAVSEFDALSKHMPDATDKTNVRVQPGLGAPASANPNAVRAMRMLALASGALVILGIANLANLSLFQGLRLQHEVAIRRALGASAGRIAQMMLVESVMLASIGALAAVLVAMGIEAALADLTVWGLGAVRVPLDWRVVGGTFILAGGVGVAFGAGPAWVLARQRPSGSLDRREIPRVGRLRQGLAMLQVGVSFALCAGALLLVGSIRNLLNVDLGFDPAGVTTMRSELKNYGYDQPRTWSYYRQLLDAVSQAPGVEAAGVAFTPPLSYVYSSQFGIAGGRPSGMQELWINYATAGYFDALRIPVIRGRVFTDAESFQDADATQAVLSATAARQLFGDHDPIGQRIIERARVPHEYVVIGVTSDVRGRALTEPPAASVYFPFSPGIAVTGANVFAKSRRSPDDVVRLLRSSAAAIDRTAPLYNDQTMTDIVGKSIAEQRLFGRVLGMVGTIALILAAVGIYGLISQGVMERRRELGVRIALGATRRQIATLVARQAAVVLVVGLLMGTAAAALGGRVIEAQLFGLSARDPLTFAAVSLALSAVLAAAVVRPVRAATRVDPMRALKAE